MSNNSQKSKGFYFILGAIFIAVIGIGYYVVSGQADEPDFSIEVDENGIDIDTD